MINDENAQKVLEKLIGAFSENEPAVVGSLLAFSAIYTGQSVREYHTIAMTHLTPSLITIGHLIHNNLPDTYYAFSFWISAISKMLKFLSTHKPGLVLDFL